MNKILWVDATISSGSRTRQLSQYLMDHLSGEKKHRILENTAMSSLDLEGLQARDEHRYDISLAKEFSQANTVVFSAPYYDLSFPSLLKVYIENLCVQGVTFTYNEKGECVSLCQCQKAYYVCSAGGIVHRHLGYAYIQDVLGYFFGCKDTHLILAQKLDIEGIDIQAQLQEAQDAIDQLVS